MIAFPSNPAVDDVVVTGGISYTFTANGWRVSPANYGLVGPQGPQGEAGPQGEPGADGGGAAASVGSLITSAEVLTAPNWLLCDGSTYLQSAYPALYAALGKIPDYSAAGKLSFTSSTLPAAQYWYCMAFGNGKFAAACDGASNVAYSTLGLTWTAASMPVSTNWRGMVYGANKFVAISEAGNCATSTDGVSWAAGPSLGGSTWRAITYGNGLFVACAANGGSNSVATSPDELSWTVRNIGVSRSWESIAYGNGLFVMGAVADGTIAYSSNGIAWTTVTLPDGSATPGMWKVVFGNGIFLAVSSASAAAAAQTVISSDGTVWTPAPLPVLAGMVWSTLCFGDGVFLATGYGSRYATSLDGIHWVVRSKPSAGASAIAYGNGVFVTVSQNSPYTNAASISGIPYNQTTHFAVPRMQQLPGAKTYIRATA